MEGHEDRRHMASCCTPTQDVGNVKNLAPDLDAHKSSLAASYLTRQVHGAISISVNYLPELKYSSVRPPDRNSDSYFFQIDIREQQCGPDLMSIYHDLKCAAQVASCGPQACVGDFFRNLHVLQFLPALRQMHVWLRLRCWRPGEGHHPDSAPGSCPFSPVPCLRHRQRQALDSPQVHRRCRPQGPGQRNQSYWCQNLALADLLAPHRQGVPSDIHITCDMNGSLEAVTRESTTRWGSSPGFFMYFWRECATSTDFKHLWSPRNKHG